MNNIDPRVFACMCCFEKRWQETKKAFVCQYLANGEYCAIVKSVWEREHDPEKSWLQKQRNLEEIIKKGTGE